MDESVAETGGLAVRDGDGHTDTHCGGRAAGDKGDEADGEEEEDYGRDVGGEDGVNHSLILGQSLKHAGETDHRADHNGRSNTLDEGGGADVLELGNLAFLSGGQILPEEDCGKDKADHGSSEDFNAEHVEGNYKGCQRNECDDSLGALFFVIGDDVGGTVGKCTTLGNIFLDHPGHDEQDNDDFGDHTYNTADKTSVGGSFKLLHTENVSNLNRTRKSNTKGINAVEGTHYKLLGHACTLKKTHGDGIERDDGDEGVHAAVGEDTSCQNTGQNTGNVVSGLGRTFLEQQVSHGVTEGVNSTSPAVDLGNEAAGEQAGEDRLDHAAQTSKVHIIHGFAIGEAVEQNANGSSDNADNNGGPSLNYQNSNKSKPNQYC